MQDQAKSHSITEQHLEQHIFHSVITLIYTNDRSWHMLLERAFMNEIIVESIQSMMKRGEGAAANRAGLKQTYLKINLCTNSSTHYPV